jgi:hypothetical protein
MENNKSQSNIELPSTKKLLKSTFFAIAIAAIILVTTVLPAEYGIDPSGVGDLLGLTSMGKIKVSLAEEATIINSKANNMSEMVTESITDSETSQPEVIDQKGKMVISLKPNEGIELKLYMKKDDIVNYSWFTDGATIKYDAHTDSGDYHCYNKGSKEKDEGILKAFYNGRHGWYWKNRTAKIVTITLQVNGMYADFREES